MMLPSYAATDNCRRRRSTAQAFTDRFQAAAAKDTFELVEVCDALNPLSRIGCWAGRFWRDDRHLNFALLPLPP